MVGAAAMEMTFDVDVVSHHAGNVVSFDISFDSMLLFIWLNATHT